MVRCTLLATIAFAWFGTVPFSVGEEVLFEDDFDGTLSSEWRAVGLTKDDYRIRDGGLEMRVQPGRRARDTPMLMVLLPFKTSEFVTASVELTLLDRFTEPAESAGLFLTDADSREFGGEKKNRNGHLVFLPGDVEFIGEEGEEGDPQQYAMKFWPANEVYGSLRIIVRGNYGHFQVGPSRKGKYLNFFHSALRKDEPRRGFSLSASGGPSDRDHWVRFDNFRVTRK
ncbi:hypothetical protein CA13_10360 [Planctomycetes bacterium CA13]|uniref:3-keto-disaccharide hydrolase domain-containing protein n=1 Tax=Novipirellula herctigrandis TaxID=2527986 RepID=A0A5C5YX87_9BACT|nr:hypothetical protein CA13_10360 [Planctomycetes bacterium CA13]